MVYVAIVIVIVLLFTSETYGEVFTKSAPAATACLQASTFSASLR